MNIITTPAQVGYTPAATAIVHSTTASLTSRAPVQPVHLVQYDQTMPAIAVALTSNGQPYTVPSGAAVNVRMDKPDGTHVYDPALGVSTDGQTAYIGITAQMTAAAGSSGPIVEIVVNEGVAGTAAFPIIIDPNPVPDAAYESTDEYLTLYEILQQAQDAAQIVQQNAQNLQNVTDNLTAIQNAAANAQAAAQSAQEAQTAAQQALGFRTFFSAVSPDENGDLDPSHPMTTPAAQASWTIKSKGDRIQSVQVNGFTEQSGTGDPSPANVRELSTAGLPLVKLVFDGSSDENWALSGSGGKQFFAIYNKLVNIDTSNLILLSSHYKRTYISNLSNENGISNSNLSLYVQNMAISTIDEWKKHLENNPLVVWYKSIDESQATGLYIPVQAQGHEYRCQCLELTAELCDGDKVESCVPSGCDKVLTVDGSTVMVAVSGSNYVVTAADASVGGNVYAEGLAYLSLAAGQIVIPASSFPASVTSAQTANAWLQSNPQKVWYQSADYTEADDIPVELETHNGGICVLDGTQNKFTASGAFWNLPANSALAGVRTSYFVNGACTAFPASIFSGNPQHNRIFTKADKMAPYFNTVDELNAFLVEQNAAGTPVVLCYPITTPVVYAHDPVTLVAVPYTEEDAATAQQLAATPSTLPYIDSADVPMLLDDTGMSEPDVMVQSDGTLDNENTQKAAEWIQETAQRLMATSLASTPPVAGTYVVSSQDGTTVLVSLKAMQDGGDAATLGGMTLDEIKQLISDMIAAAASGS